MATTSRQGTAQARAYADPTIRFAPGYNNTSGISIIEDFDTIPYSETITYGDVAPVPEPTT